MKQKFSMLKTEDGDNLIIKEFSEVDKGIFTISCEESYDSETIVQSIEKGKKDLIAALRTRNIYPSTYFVEQIADAVMDLYKSSGNEPVEIILNEINALHKVEKVQPVENVEVEKKGKIEDLLDDSLDESDSSVEGVEDIKKIEPSVPAVKAEVDDSVDKPKGD
jgi:hypothetical protein